MIVVNTANTTQNYLQMFRSIFEAASRTSDEDGGRVRFFHFSQRISDCQFPSAEPRTALGAVMSSPIKDEEGIT
jgi:hypothetical protein